MNYFAVSLVIVFYLLLVRALRYRHRDGFFQRCPQYRTREGMASMSLAKASSVMQELASREFPVTFSTSIFFALFKTYGIPSISKLLVATSQLSGHATASKRRTDTGVLMFEIVCNAPCSKRNIDAVARINFLHSRWRQAGKISDDDMLYTLGLFVLEPMRWIFLYEWRDLSMLERYALAMIWKNLGQEMGISYECLEPYMDKENDALAWLESLRKWCSKYQQHHMVRAVSNEKLAQANLHLILIDFPRFAHDFIFRQLRCLMEPQVRHAMGYEDPSKLDFFIFDKLITIRRYTIKLLCLPRPRWWTTPIILDADKKTGRLHLSTYLAHPYYVKASFYSRWGPSALYTRLIGGYLPGDAGAKFCPDGYTIPELGPDSQKDEGQEYMHLTREKIRRARGCPMAFQA
ncbi:hypothetical protein LZ30DRAFT_584017 [Colletotrichum cereale]|nr:hypothetical protein LZ30DRAFT_584017 [Colletotrichum cereale]